MLKKTIIFGGALLLLIFTVNIGFAGDTIIHSCYQKSSKVMRVVDSKEECQKDEVYLLWNQYGHTLELCNLYYDLMLEIPTVCVDILCGDGQLNKWEECDTSDPICNDDCTINCELQLELCDEDCDAKEVECIEACDLTDPGCRRRCFNRHSSCKTRCDAHYRMCTSL